MLENFKEYQFFIGESGNQDGMVVLVEWKEETPYLYYFRDGLLEEKVVCDIHVFELRASDRGRRDQGFSLSYMYKETIQLYKLC